MVPNTSSPVPKSVATFVVAAYHLNCCVELEIDDHKVELSIPNPISTVEAPILGDKTILVPALLVVNVGAATPFWLKSIRFPSHDILDIFVHHHLQCYLPV